MIKCSRNAADMQRTEYRVMTISGCKYAERVRYICRVQFQPMKSTVLLVENFDSSVERHTTKAEAANLS